MNEQRAYDVPQKISTVVARVTFSRSQAVPPLNSNWPPKQKTKQIRQSRIIIRITLCGMATEWSYHLSIVWNDWLLLSYLSPLETSAVGPCWLGRRVGRCGPGWRWRRETPYLRLPQGLPRRHQILLVMIECKYERT